MKKTFDGHFMDEITVDESGIHKVVDTGDGKSYSVALIMPRETFVEAYNKYIKGEDVESPQGTSKWVNDSDGLPTCQKCGEVALQRIFIKVPQMIQDIRLVHSKYCPNCGARMLEEDNEKT